jgi:drug/metabolite transporter (DMT)-like permease
MQMIAGGLVMFTVGVCTGERVGVISATALGAFAYLTIFGSLLAFSAYQLLLHQTRPALATSYAYVNPGVALVLGALFADEPLASSQLIACALTGLAVVCVLRARAA